MEELKCVPQIGCPLCSRQGAIKYHAVKDGAYGLRGRWDYRECCECQILWIDPRPIDTHIPRLYETYYTHSADRPDRLLAKLRDSIMIAAWRRDFGYNTAASPSLLAQALSLIPVLRQSAAAKLMYLNKVNHGRLLDVGSGSGAFASKMRQLGWKVDVVEPDKEAAKHVGALGVDVFATMDACLNEREGRYDAVSMSHVIEHVPDPVGYFQKAYRLLSDQGILSIVTPNKDALGAKIFKENWRSLEAPRHLHLFSVSALQSLAEGSGFESSFVWTPSRLARLTWPASRRLAWGEELVESATPSVRLRLEAFAYWLFEAIAAEFADIGEEVALIAQKKGLETRHEI